MFSADRHLTNGTVQFVTRRTAWAIAATGVGASALALAAGVAIGARSAAPVAESNQNASEVESTNSIELSFVVGELDKLNASVAQLEPRIARLTTHVSELRGLQARLKTSKASSRVLKHVSAHPKSHEGMGGPALPPRPCTDPKKTAVAEKPEVAADAVDGTRHQVACLAETLEQLEHEALMHKAAWSALPGRLPVDGARFGSPFGNRIDPFNRNLHFHSGIDLAARTGTPIHATAGGRVIFAGQKSGYGKVIEIDHGNQLVTRYGHASRLIAKKGDVVLPRQHIADVGSTGRSTGPHLHFEVLENGEAIDPSSYLSVFEGSSYG
ncbi:M23 family metallopeptidase [Variovorax sp. GT1P44]|uniref:M23 family metallopeptidase n=1 Tax=Variovorax sp. GT1P44 TaxID=3443742 RepID=UPI003F4800F4